MQVARLAAGIGLLCAACVPVSTQNLQARHFTAEVDRAWRVDVTEAPIQGYILRAGDSLEVRLFAWLDDYPGEAPTELVYRELRRHVAIRGMVIPVDDQPCPTGERRLRVMDTDAHVREHVAVDGGYTMVVGARSNGTLLGALARDRSRIDCTGATQLARSLQELLARVRPTDPTGLSPAQLSPPPLPGRPGVL